MADTAYDADHLRKVIATKGGARRHPQQSVTCAQIPTNIFMPSAILWNAASQSLSSSTASRPASKRPPEIIGPSLLSQPCLSG